MQGLQLEGQSFLFHVCFAITAFKFKVKQDLNLKLYTLARQAKWKKTGEEEKGTQRKSVAWSRHYLTSFIFYFFAGLWLVSSQKVFSHILRTLIKRVISICGGLRGHFNQVEPVEVWIGRAGEVRVSLGEVSWLSTKRYLRTSFTLTKCPQSSMETWARNRLCQNTGHVSVSQG